MPTAPIAVFIFNRPKHLRQTLEALKKCVGFDEGRVVVFGDGPKRDEQREGVQAAREVAQQILGDRAQYRFSEKNRGLARSIIDGISSLVEEHGRVIVLEDDLNVAPGFLTFMDSALDRYADDQNVYQVSGHAFDAPELAERRSAVFIPFTTTWGWATWRRAWRDFDEAATGWRLLTQDRVLRRRFNIGGVYDFSSMIERQMKGRVDSWGVLWYWSVFCRSGLTLAPPRTLVHNMGMDGSGSHGRGVFRRFSAVSADFPDGTFELPPPMLEQDAFDAVRRAIWRRNGGALGQFIDMTKKITARLLSR
jgi:hypothetical protein